MGKTPQIICRKLTKYDANAISKIESECFALPWSREDFWREVDNKLAEYVVMEIDKEIVAYAGAWISFNQAEVMNVVVKPKFQNQGIGTLLFSKLIENIKKRGANSITLEVRPSNIAAIKIYEKFGLKSVGRRRKYYLDNDEDALIMWNTQL